MIGSVISAEAMDAWSSVGLLPDGVSLDFANSTNQTDGRALKLGADYFTVISLTVNQAHDNPAEALIKEQSRWCSPGLEAFCKQNLRSEYPEGAGLGWFVIDKVRGGLVREAVARGAGKVSLAIGLSNSQPITEGVTGSLVIGSWDNGKRLNVGVTGRNICKQYRNKAKFTLQQRDALVKNKREKPASYEYIVAAADIFGLFKGALIMAQSDRKYTYSVSGRKFFESQSSIADIDGRVRAFILPTYPVKVD